MNHTIIIRVGNPEREKTSPYTSNLHRCRHMFVGERTLVMCFFYYYFIYFD